jgi:hypothetical protein
MTLSLQIFNFCPSVADIILYMVLIEQEVQVCQDESVAPTEHFVDFANFDGLYFGTPDLFVCLCLSSP